MAEETTDGGSQEQLPDHCRIEDFVSYLPEHRYIYKPTGALWPKESINSVVPYKIANPETGKRMLPAAYLDQFDAVEQMTWAPGYPDLILGQVLQEGGWMVHPGARVYNLYHAPPVYPGNIMRAQIWLDHLKLIYPEDWEHIVLWCAHRIQKPYEKINHALVLGGSQGIGKDTLLDPVKHGVGAWNWSEISPRHVLGRFNGWVKSVIVRLNETRDLGDKDRFMLYDTLKTYIAAPPDVLRIDEKNVREYSVFNVLGLIITTNNRLDGIYLPPDDRRHYVAWSDKMAGDFSEDYWRNIWHYYESGGYEDVIAYLRTYNSTGFDAKAPPEKTPAFSAIVQTAESGETTELRDVMDLFNNECAISIEDIVNAAERFGYQELANDLRERKYRAKIPHMLLRVGYIPVRSANTKDGLWIINKRRCSLYCRQGMSYTQQAKLAKDREKNIPNLKLV